MVFKRKRGRPRINRQVNDAGTAELQLKRKMGLTSEPLDVLHARRFVSEAQHKMGMRLRWLYTLKFGLPTVKAADLSDEKRTTHSKERDECWQEQKEAEYHSAVTLLRQLGVKRVLFHICIYQQWPYWLVDYQLLGKKELCPLARREIEQLKLGLDTLAIFLVKPRDSAKNIANKKEGKGGGEK